MIYNKRFFMAAILILVIGTSLNIILSQLGHFAGSNASMVSIPISSEQGYFASGLALLAMMVTGMILLLVSLKQKRTAAFFISLAAIILIPPIIQSIL